MKKLFVLIIIFVILAIVPTFDVGINNHVFATNNDIENKLSDEINSQIEGMDIDELEELYENNKFDVGESKSFKEIITQIINGEFVFSFSNIFSSIAKLAGNSLGNVLPSLAIILVLGLLSVFISSLQLSDKSSMKNIVFYVFFVVIVSTIIGTCYVQLSSTINMLSNIQKQIEIISPVLLSLIIAVGGSSSAGIYQPAVLMLSGTIIEILMVIVTPIFVFSIICAVIGNISESTKLSKFQDLLSSAFKIIIGLVFTIFVAFLSIQGITASTVDGISIKTAKYAIRSYVPIVGGYISEGFEIFRAGSVLIKNSIGVVALVILFGTILSQIIGILALMWGLKLVAALLEPIADARITKFISNISKSFIYLIAIVLSVAIMYFLTVLLIISTANIF